MKVHVSGRDIEKSCLGFPRATAPTQRALKFKAQQDLDARGQKKNESDNMILHALCFIKIIKQIINGQQAILIQSHSTHPIHLKITSGLRVKIELLNPCGTELFISTASSKVCTKRSFQT